MKCYVCGFDIRDRYYPTEWGNICNLCFRPELLCFACDRQLLPGRESRLADYRVVCPNCSADAVYRLDREFVVGIKRHLPWFPRKKLIFHVVDLPELQKIQGGTGITTFGKCRTLFYGEPSWVTIIEHHIYVLFGLPRQLCEATLVHELFHAWMNEAIPMTRYETPHKEWLCETMALQFLRQVSAPHVWLARREYACKYYPALRGAENKSMAELIDLLLKTR